MSASRPTTSSSPSATTCAPATRPAPASTRSCWPSSRSPRRPRRRWAWWSGRWSSSRPTTRWRAAARVAAADPRSSRSSSARPDKDLAQCVRGRPRRAAGPHAHATRSTRPGCSAKFGVAPASIPDCLALVGDSADGYPGPPGLGREVGRRRARPLAAPRCDPRPTPARLGRRRSAARPALAADAAAAARGRRAVPHAGHAGGRRRPRHDRRRPALDRPHRPLPGDRAGGGRPGPARPRRAPDRAPGTLRPHRAPSERTRSGDRRDDQRHERSQGQRRAQGLAAVPAIAQRLPSPRRRLGIPPRRTPVDGQVHQEGHTRSRRAGPPARRPRTPGGGARRRAGRRSRAAARHRRPRPGAA